MGGCSRRCTGSFAEWGDGAQPLPYRSACFAIVLLCIWFNIPFDLALDAYQQYTNNRANPRDLGIIRSISARRGLATWAEEYKKARCSAGARSSGSSGVPKALPVHQGRSRTPPMRPLRSPPRPPTVVPTEELPRRIPSLRKLRHLPRPPPLPDQAPPLRAPAQPLAPPPAHLSPIHTGATRIGIRPSLMAARCKAKPKNPSPAAKQPAAVPIGLPPPIGSTFLGGSIHLARLAQASSGVLVPAADVEEKEQEENFDDDPEVRDATMSPDAWQCIRCHNLNSSSHGDCTNKRCGAKKPEESDRSQTRHRQNIAPLRSHM